MWCTPDGSVDSLWPKASGTPRRGRLCRHLLRRRSRACSNATIAIAAEQMLLVSLGSRNKDGSRVCRRGREVSRQDGRSRARRRDRAQRCPWRRSVAYAAASRDLARRCSYDGQIYSEPEAIALRHRALRAKETGVTIPMPAVPIRSGSRRRAPTISCFADRSFAWWRATASEVREGGSPARRPRRHSRGRCG
jgi:hypothetical protein